MLDCPMSEWKPKCKIIGAPKGLDVEQCLTAANSGSCDAFQRGNCEVHGKQQDFVLSSIDLCQVCFHFRNYLLFKSWIHSCYRAFVMIFFTVTFFYLTLKMKSVLFIQTFWVLFHVRHTLDQMNQAMII